MFNILLVLAIVATIVSIAALVVGSVALAIVIGVKNSTHQVVFKEMTPPNVSVDPFEAALDEEPEAQPSINPNKRMKKETFQKFDNSELNAKDTSFSDLDSPEVSSNFN